LRNVRFEGVKWSVTSVGDVSGEWGVEWSVVVWGSEWRVVVLGSGGSLGLVGADARVVTDDAGGIGVVVKETISGWRELGLATRGDGAWK
jgi:hypothetical protein